jgi:hypothetical protein
MAFAQDTFSMYDQSADTGYSQSTFSGASASATGSSTLVRNHTVFVDALKLIYTQEFGNGSFPFQRAIHFGWRWRVGN